MFVICIDPRQVRNDRGYTWSTDNLDDGLPLEGVIQYNNGTEVIEIVDTATYQPVSESPLRKVWESQLDTEILGYIPQASHTFGLIEGLYGIMNEFQVSIGESTCAAKLYAAPVGYDANGVKVVDGTGDAEGVGKALLDISELSQIALERCKTAREAVLLMGELAMQYGYYSADWSVANGINFAMAEGGEALTVTDPNEAWMVHMLPDPTGTSVIWCAQRVPDGHITAVANTFVIRDVIEMVPYNLESIESDFLYSSNMYTIAENMAWWSRTDNVPLNFLKVWYARYTILYTLCIMFTHVTCTLRYCCIDICPSQTSRRVFPPPHLEDIRRVRPLRPPPGLYERLCRRLPLLHPSRPPPEGAGHCGCAEGPLRRHAVQPDGGHCQWTVRGPQ